MSNYQPKINPAAVQLGYLRADPAKAGVASGYATRITEPPKQQAKATKRPNPYITKK